MNRSDGFKKRNTITIDLPDGNSVVVMRATSRDFLEAGLDPVVIGEQATRPSTLDDLKATLAESENDVMKQMAFMDGLLKRCLVDPKYWDGPRNETPDGHVCYSHLGDENAAIIINHLMDDFREAEDAAKTAAEFRQTANG